jgi:hypothetical protein
MPKSLKAECITNAVGIPLGPQIQGACPGIHLTSQIPNTRNDTKYAPYSMVIANRAPHVPSNKLLKQLFVY